MTTFLGIIIFLILLAICVYGLRESQKAAEKHDRQRAHAPTSTGGSHASSPSDTSSNT